MYRYIYFQEVKYMLLSHKTIIKLSDNYSNIIGHMCYAAYKLWNICNYEKLHNKELNLPVSFPDWYYQKAAHKNNLWYKQLPSQTAQEICKQLNSSWNSYFKLLKTGGIKNPKPPRFKHDNIAVTYMQNGIMHNSDVVRLSISKGLKDFMSKEYGINDDYLYLKNPIFKNIDTIKQIKIYPPEGNCCNVIVIYEVPDIIKLADNGKYLSIDLGLKNLMTCLNSETGETFIIGKKYLSLCRYYYKEIARIQSQWYHQQIKMDIKYPKSSKHIKKMYIKKNNVIKDYLHKITRHIVNYCKANGINTVVVGDITGIRKDNVKDDKYNQKMHFLSYDKIYQMLEYKLALEGINFIKQNEAYSSQTSPLADKVCKKNAEKSNRVYRGLYVDGENVWNADCVGAYNILRLYLKNDAIKLSPYDIKVPKIIKVAA